MRPKTTTIRMEITKITLRTVENFGFTTFLYRDKT